MGNKIPTPVQDLATKCAYLDTVYLGSENDESFMSEDEKAYSESLYTQIVETAKWRAELKGYDLQLTTGPINIVFDETDDDDDDDENDKDFGEY